MSADSIDRSSCDHWPQYIRGEISQGVRGRGANAKLEECQRYDVCLMLASKEQVTEAGWLVYISRMHLYLKQKKGFLAPSQVENRFGSVGPVDSHSFQNKYKFYIYIYQI